MALNSKQLEEIWHRHDDFRIVTPGQEEQLCVYAHNLTVWTEEYCMEAVKSRNVVAINRSICLLTHQYFNYKAAIPKVHRHHYSERGHSCIYTIFERSYHRLNAELLRINPPVLMESVPPPAPVYKVYQIGSFPIGEVEAEDDE